MEPGSLAPSSRRTVHAVLAVSAALIAGISTAFALDLVSAADPVTMAVALASAGVAALASHASRSSWLPVLGALGVSYGLAFALHDHAGRDASVAAAGAVMAVILFRPISRAHIAAAQEGALDRFECIALTAGRSLFVVGLLGLITHLLLIRALGVMALAAAVGLLAMVMWRDRVRMRFLTRVYANADARYRIERDADVSGFELLPPVLSGTLTDAVIAHVATPHATYRTSDGPRPVARVTSSLARMLARLDKRARAASTLVGMAVCTTSLMAVTPFEWTTTRETRLALAVDAPACRDARAYFAERLEAELPSIGRATLLTRAQDPSIAEDHGVILLVPREVGRKVDEATKARARAIASAIPCNGKLAFAVEEPTYRPFTLSATLALEPGADRTMVLHDAAEQVREMFQPDARVIYNEPVDFGNAEKTFGYRVRHALRHVLGVKGVHLTINGGESDVLLAPRDFPTLASLTLE